MTNASAVYQEAYYADEKPRYLAHAAEDSEWSALFWNDRLDIFERLLPEKRRRILDIGCGPGWFLKSAKARGWDVHGIDPSRQAVEHAHSIGIGVTQQEFDIRAKQMGIFDVVHMNNVLEHLPHPAETLALARDMLSPDGLICVCVPNDYSPFQRSAAKEIGEWWVDPHHLNYFDFASLARLLLDQGFVEIERTTSFPMEMFLLMGRNYTQDQGLGRACHNERKRFDMSLEPETRRTFYSALASVGLGREAVIVARVP